MAELFAQEGIELVRNMRDDNWLNGRNWKENINIAVYAIDRANAIAGTVISVDNITNSDARLLINDDGLYQHSAGTNTMFYRAVTADTANCSDADDCLHLISSVRWSERGNTYNYQTEAYLYNWQ